MSVPYKIPGNGNVAILSERNNQLLKYISRSLRIGKKRKQTCESTINFCAAITSDDYTVATLKVVSSKILPGLKKFEPS